MSIVRFNQNQSNPAKEFFKDDYLWGFPFLPVTGKQLADMPSIFQPAIDVAEDKDRFILKADLPGLNKDEIRLSVENGVLTIEGERKSETEHKDREYHMVERSYGRFVRSFNLGSLVDDDKIAAHYKEGVLEITVPKIEKAKAKTINVNVN